MVELKLLLILLSLEFLICNGYYLTKFVDFREFDPKCVAEYVNKYHNFSVRIR
jgi:hypothetical protein